MNLQGKLLPTEQIHHCGSMKPFSHFMMSILRQNTNFKYYSATYMYRYPCNYLLT